MSGTGEEKKDVAAAGAGASAAASTSSSTSESKDEVIVWLMRHGVAEHNVAHKGTPYFTHGVITKVVTMVNLLKNINGNNLAKLP